MLLNHISCEILKNFEMKYGYILVITKLSVCALPHLAVK